MAFERYRLPTLIGQGGMGKVIAAAAAAIALAPFSVLATTPGVAQAAPWVALPAWGRPAQAPPSRVPVQTPEARPEPADDRDAGADPTGRSAKSPAPEHDSGGGRSGGAHPTLVAHGAALRGVGDSSVLCRLDDPSFRENVERAPDG